MATQSPSRPAVGRSESFVAQQLNRASFRVRLLDVASSLLGFGIFFLAFGLTMVLCDRWLSDLPARVRQVSFIGFMLASAGYIGATLIWPLCRRVNPYYAARKVEDSLPNAKNSVVSWLDLHDQPLPGAFRTAVANRAAVDLGKADLERALSARRTLVLGIVAAVLLIFVAVQLVLGGREFMSRLGRVFAPFTEISSATRTQLQLIEPKGGNVTVSVGRAVSIAVEVRGIVPGPTKPDAVRLQYRYHPGDPLEEKLFERESPGSVLWLAQMPAFQLHNGFWYRVAGGDAVTDEYRVDVRATPLVEKIDVLYHYRPYLAWPDVRTTEPNLEGPRGTEVTLLVRTNRQVKDGTVEIVNKPITVPGELVAEDPHALRFRTVLNEDGSYRIWFTSIEGERNTEPIEYRLKVQRDYAPKVELTKPGKDVVLPANSVLQLAGRAEDDFGVTGMTLRMRVNKENLKPRPFRDGQKDKFRLADGSYPQKLDYLDVIELDKLRDSLERPLAGGAIIEYWLEAADACDYPPPGPNVGKSEVFKVQLAKPEEEKSQQQQRDDAKQAKKDFEKNQDHKQQQKNQEIKNKADPQSEKPSKNPDGTKPDDKSAKNSPAEKPLTPEEQQQNNLLDQKTNEIDNNSQKARDKGNGQASPAENKGDGQPKDGPKPDGQEGKAGASKPQPEKAGDAGESKSQGKKPSGADQKNGESKPAGKDKTQQQANNPGEGKSAPADKKQSGQSKSEGKQGPNQEKTEAQAKGDGQNKSAPKNQAGASKPPSAGSQSAGQSKGDGKKEPDKKDPGKGDGRAQAKNDGKPPPAGQGKGDGADKQGQNATAQGSSKGAGNKPKGSGAPAESRPAGDKSQEARGSSKGDGTAKPGPNDNKQAGADQAKDLQGQAQSADPQKRQEALDKLQELSRNAKTQPERDAASKALKELAEQAQNENHGNGKSTGTQQTNNSTNPKNPPSPQDDKNMKGAPQKVQNLFKEAQSDDPKRRKEAIDNLEELLRNGKPAERAGASEAMKQLAQQGKGTKPADDKKGLDLDALAKQAPKMKDLIDRLQAKNPRERKQAQSDLKDLQRNGKTKAEREAAEELLKHLGEDCTLQAKKGGKNPNGGTGKSRPMGEGVPTEPGQPKNTETPGTTAGNGHNPGVGDKPGVNPQAPNLDDPSLAKTSPNNAGSDRAGEMQIEHWKKNVTKEMLDKWKISDADWQRYLNRRRAEMDARQPKADPSIRRRPGSSFVNEGPQQVQGGAARNDQASGSSRPKLPPELRDVFKEFTEKLGDKK